MGCLFVMYLISFCFGHSVLLFIFFLPFLFFFNILPSFFPPPLTLFYTIYYIFSRILKKSNFSWVEQHWVYYLHSRTVLKIRSSWPAQFQLYILLSFWFVCFGFCFIYLFICLLDFFKERNQEVEYVKREAHN